MEKKEGGVGWVLNREVLHSNDLFLVSRQEMDLNYTGVIDSYLTY